MPDSFAVLIPYYNESAYIAETLRSLLRQSRVPDQVILVDNASSDGSADICREVIVESGYQGAIFLREERPGKVNALESGLALVRSTYVATCDADILYPSHYLALAAELFSQAPPDVVAVMAQYVESLPGEDAETREMLRRNVRLSRVFTSKCFTGGAGQIFRTDTLKRAGGFSAERWNYVLMDHEIVHRVHKLGRSLYHRDMWCLHTDRRKDRSRVRWNLLDRMLYRYTPKFLGDWYFYSYLGPRLARRKMTGLNLRAQPWAVKNG
jgi:glycosyltransferase involved in cell wall biosynthesis